MHQRCTFSAGYTGSPARILLNRILEQLWRCSSSSGMSLTILLNMPQLHSSTACLTPELHCDNLPCVQTAALYGVMQLSYDHNPKHKQAKLCALQYGNMHASSSQKSEPNTLQACIWMASVAAFRTPLYCCNYPLDMCCDCMLWPYVAKVDSRNTCPNR